MNLKIISIELECKSGNISYQFNEHITALYGNIGVGKTSLMNLISFCFGNDLVRTIAIDDQVLCCMLTVNYCAEMYVFTRRISSNFISVKTRGKEIQLRIKDGYTEGTITDYLYELEGLKALFWIPKNSSVQKKVKITYPNFYWFSYLKQDEIDNSLFYFKDSQNYYKEMASRNVLFDCLGGNIQAEVAFQNMMRNNASVLEETNQKISFGNELRAATRLFSVNISNEIIKKKSDVLKLKENLKALLSSVSLSNSENSFDDILSIQYKIGLYEAEIKYLSVFGKIKMILDSHVAIKQEIENEINMAENEKTEQFSKNMFLNENIELLKDFFIDTLYKVGFPGIEEGDIIKLTAKDFSPVLYSYSNKKKADFYSLSSGGKKTIYKICYAIAIHRLIKERNLATLIPQMLIIDTPMKNISEREDVELYNSLFSLLLNLFSRGGQLETTQLILVDKELHPYFCKEDITQYHFTKENPLIPFYCV